MQTRQRRSSRCIVAFAFLSSILSLSFVHADSAWAQKPLDRHPRHGDEVWLVDTHQLKHASSIDCGLQVSQWSQQGWVRTGTAQLLESINGDRNISNVFFVHGNRTNLFWGVSRGEFIYQQLLTQREFVGRVRFIIWAWPSEKESGPIRDFKIKAERADQEGQYFGWLLARCRPPHPIGLIGYSFGTRVVMGGLAVVANQGLAVAPIPANQSNPSTHDANRMAREDAVYPFSSRYITHRIDDYQLGIIERRIVAARNQPHPNQTAQISLSTPSGLSKTRSLRRGYMGVNAYPQSMMASKAESQLERIVTASKPQPAAETPDDQKLISSLVSSSAPHENRATVSRTTADKADEFVSANRAFERDAISTSSKILERGSANAQDRNSSGISSPLQQQASTRKYKPVYRVALIAAACDQAWFNSPQHYRAAYDLADQVLLITNSNDQALKYFGFIARGGFPKALGSVGYRCLDLLPDFGRKLDQIDVAQWVGRKHRIDLYLGSPVVIEQTCNLLLGL